MPKRARSPETEVQTGSKRVKQQTIYNVIFHEVDWHNAYDRFVPETTEIRGTYDTLEKANSVARKILLDKWGAEYFDKYEEKVDDEGKVHVNALCPEGEVLDVYVEEKGVALKVKPMFLVMKDDSTTGAKGSTQTVVDSAHISAASANVRVKELVEELRMGKIGKEGSIETAENRQGLLVAHYKKKGAKKSRDVVYSQKMKLMDLLMGEEDEQNGIQSGGKIMNTDSRRERLIFVFDE